jgi:tRNA acetyltransferase TAN1
LKNFNLLVSAPRFNETDAKAELWFVLLICGDKYPIISNLEYQGLITAFTNLPELEIIKKIKEILEKDPHFFNYVLKIVPIQFICETDLTLIKRMVKDNYNRYIKKQDSFRITLKRRKNKLIERDILIEAVAKLLDNPVDLENPDKIIRIELLDTVCGISFLEKGDIIRPTILNPKN